jgi:glycosyltransferase involved in cell wall biosynthesis
MSNSLVEFVKSVSATLRGNELRFLGADRTEAARQLQIVGAVEHEMTLLEAREEWCFVTDLSAAFIIYKNRPDVREAFPDILDRDHEAFCNWLNHFPQSEHAAPPALGDRSRRCSAIRSLARIFSFLSRHEEASGVCQESLLLDDPSSVLQCLIRGAGDGLEYDLDDVIVLQCIHETKRQLLVPLYLELPLVRAQAAASRIAPANRSLLPERIRDAGWAIAGCRLHASYFDNAEASLDQEMRHWSSIKLDQFRRRVDGVLHKRVNQPAFRCAAMVQPAVASRAASAEPADQGEGRDEQAAANIFGYFFSDIGLGESSRGLAKAMSLLRRVQKIPFCTMQLRENATLTDLFHHFDYSADTNVFVTYPHQKEDLLAMMRPEQVLGRRNVSHLAWEQNDANRWWEPVYHRYDEIWAISTFAATPFLKMFPGRVRVVPNVIDFETFPAVDCSGRLAGQLVQYLFVFDANSSIERKNPEGVIDAFTKAFAGTRHTGRVRLTLKIVGVNRAEHSNSVRRLLRKASTSGLAITFDSRYLSRQAALEQIAAADRYVSLHRAEGFGYTMAEAMFYGVPVIASGYSGNLEYMTTENSFLVPCKEAFVKTADGPFQRGSVWGDPDVDAAAELMRLVAEAPSQAIGVGVAGQKSVTAGLSAGAVAERLRSYLSTTDERPNYGSPNVISLGAAGR